MNTSVYAKPVMPRIVLRPALATLFLHGLLIYVLTANWTNTERESHPGQACAKPDQRPSGGCQRAKSPAQAQTARAEEARAEEA